ncbi:MAG TPA: T9SS type A sorting domain-containing protein, partial [Saprospiraceae bacterium]|nr:T9SS type A sorting domain-containing protein [Saprospiraceae bacterium]
AQIVYDDAEGTNLPWAEAFGDGVYNGRVANPPDQDPLGVNGSSMVNSYTKSGEHAYSLLIAVLVDPIDLSVNHQFRIQVNAPVATQFIFKIEGSGEALEQTRNIAVTNAWIEYTFDFSAAAGFTTINKFILFFDPGVMESSDTYLFDNIVALPAGPCTGVAVNPLIVDDFECQRNGTYGVPGFLDVTPIANPDPSGINTSETVGEYCDTCGAEWHALVYDWNSPEVFPVTQEGSSVVNIKVWTNKAGTLKFKLEGGMSPGIERDVQVTELNSWQDYSVDFSDQIGASHRKLVFFFNAGILPEPTDVYYIDDIRLSAPPTGSVLEDFEDGLDLVWESLGDPGVFGTFNGAVANPDPNAINDSPSVGSYTKGTSQFGGVQAFLPLGFTLEDFPQLNLQIYAPAGATELTMKLFSPSQGLKAVTVDIMETGVWEQLSFIFSDFVSITDFEELEIVFDENLMTQDTWLFDNLTQGLGTVDPCEGTIPDATIIDDFDCQRNVAVTGGADRLTVETNPFPGGANPDPLDKVGAYADPQDEWSALVYDFGAPLDLSSYNQLRIKIWSPLAVPLLFKLEGGTAPAVEVWSEVTQANNSSWIAYTIDFSAASETDHTRLAIFFNAGQLPAGADVYYLDDVLWRREPFTACVMDFETVETTFTDWTYFGAGKGTVFEVSVNPDQTGVNPSANVGTFIEPAGDPVWAGMFVDLPAPIALPTSNKTIKMKIWSDHEATMVMKLEGGLDGAPGSGDNGVLFSTPNQWAELTWDFTALVPDNALYGRLTLIPDIGNAPAEPVTYYFDDVEIADSECGPSGIFNINVDKLAMYPNPATDILLVEQSEDLRIFRIMNIMGQTLTTQVTSGQTLVEFDVDALVDGVYVLTAYDAHGVLKASGRFVKE